MCIRDSSTALHYCQLEHRRDAGFVLSVSKGACRVNTLDAADDLMPVASRDAPVVLLHASGVYYLVGRSLSLVTLYVL